MNSFGGSSRMYRKTADDFLTLSENELLEEDEDDDVFVGYGDDEEDFDLDEDNSEEDAQLKRALLLSSQARGIKHSGYVMQLHLTPTRFCILRPWPDLRRDLAFGRRDRRPQLPLHSEPDLEGRLQQPRGRPREAEPRPVLQRRIERRVADTDTLASGVEEEKVLVSRI